MAGLLDFLASEAAQPGLLSLSMAGGNLGQIAGGLLQQQVAAEDRKIKQAYIRSQIAENESQARQRDAQLAQAKTINDMLASRFGRGAGAGSAGGGAPQGLLGGGSPSGGAAVAAQPGGFPLSLEEVTLLKAMKGPDLLDAYKFSQEGIKREAGATYIDPVTGKVSYTPKVGEGIMYGPNGAAPIPGYANAQAEIAGATTAANERAKYPYSVGMARENANIGADNDLVVVQLPSGPRQMTRAQARDLANQAFQPQGGGSPQIGGGQQLTPQLRQLIAQDAAANGIENPTTNFTGAGRGQAYGLANAMPQQQSGPGIPLQTAAQAEADKITAVANANKGAEDRNKSDQFSILNRQIDKARQLLKSGPTASGIGAMADQVNSVFGVNTPSAEKAAALDAAAGWMVQNVPKAPGAQSDAELRDYAKSVGNVGDRRLPVEQRLAALQTAEDISKIWRERAGGGQSAPTEQSQQPTQRQVFDSRPAANQSNRGRTIQDDATGKRYRSNGMQWIEVQ